MAINLPNQRDSQYNSIVETLDKFPSLVKWRNGKLNDLADVLATFFNYISDDRKQQGFLEVMAQPTSMTTVPPIITRDMINYVAGDIFPCSSMIKEDRFVIFRAPQAIREAIESRIKKGISNRSFLQAPEDKSRTKKIAASTGDAYNWNTSQFYDGSLRIQPEVAQIIWTYLSNGMEALAYGSTTDEEIADKIAATEAAVLAQRNCNMNYGFNTDMENCAFQAVLYLVVTIADWLEVDEIGEDEIKTVYKIIYPRDLQSGIFNPTKNKLLRGIISRAIESKGLLPNKKALDLIATIMMDVEKRIDNMEDKNSKKLMTRMMGFCQPV